eukprot:NODE_374_length_1069_cov_2829.190196_g233_i0.p3 GENE.NODE_374_length_1069_cov_2829.190196_g233_i0~~NODE_374_length_1069_cov_2829.190196_g233_i0.p3  ORF type:complete len:78 (-),score=10.05 NODE_374_length_1069_cov_2829.190196_g233_i0:250-483(-)
MTSRLANRVGRRHRITFPLNPLIFEVYGCKGPCCDAQRNDVEEQMRNPNREEAAEREDEEAARPCHGKDNGAVEFEI